MIWVNASLELYSWSGEELPRLQVNPFLGWDHYSEADEAISSIIKQKLKKENKLIIKDMVHKNLSEPIKQLCFKATSNKAHQKALLASVAFNFYLIARDLSPQEQSFVDWLKDNTPEISAKGLLHGLVSSFNFVFV